MHSLKLGFLGPFDFGVCDQQGERRYQPALREFICDVLLVRRSRARGRVMQRVTVWPSAGHCGIKDKTQGCWYSQYQPVHSPAVECH
eukprot:3920528-Rhodomonas_salina.2